MQEPSDVVAPSAGGSEPSSSSGKEADDGEDEPRRWFGTIMLWLVPIALVVSGILFWMIAEKKDLLVSTYIIVQVVTTIGYGDYTPTTSGGRIFMGIYVLAALIVLAYYFNILVVGCLQRREKALCAYLQSLEDPRYPQSDSIDRSKSSASSAYKLGSPEQVIASFIPFLFCAVAGILFFRFSEGPCSCMHYGVHIEGCSEDTFQSCASHNGHVIGWAGSFYITMITLTTVGFGDEVPHTRLGYLFCIFWMLIGVAATALFTASLSRYLFESEQKQHFVMSDFLDSVTDEVFQRIDRNKDGKLSRGEFLSFTLMKYGGISEGLIEEINKEFEATDTTGENKVTFDMILARQNVIQNKLVEAHPGSKHMTPTASSAV